MTGAAFLCLWTGPAQSPANHRAVSEMRVWNGISSTRPPVCSLPVSFPLWKALGPALHRAGEQRDCCSEFSLEPSEPGVVQKFSESNSSVPFPVLGLSEERESRAACFWHLRCVHLWGGGAAIHKCILERGALPSKSLLFGWNVITNRNAGEKSAHNSRQQPMRLFDG